MSYLVEPPIFSGKKREYRRFIFILGLILIFVYGSVGSSAFAAGFADDMGRRITIKKPFKRIISLYAGHTENLFTLGLSSEIIGVSMNETYPDEALTKQVFSYKDDLEKFLAAKPDLVLVRPMIDRGYARLLTSLEKAGITVVSLQPGTLEEVFIYWMKLGTLTGKEAQAEQLILYFKESVEEIRGKVKRVSPKKKVYFEAIHGRMKTFSPGSMAIFALETAGGINIAKDAQPVRETNIAAYGKERILSHALDIDVFIAQSGPMNFVTIEMIRNEPGFSAIKAVQNNQIYLVDERLVSRPTFRLLEGIKVISRILYPDLKI